MSQCHTSAFTFRTGPIRSLDIVKGVMGRMYATCDEYGEKAPAPSRIHGDIIFRPGRQSTCKYYPTLPWSAA